MNIAQKLQEKWNVSTAEFAKRFGISYKTAKSWLDGGNPKELGNQLLHHADCFTGTFDTRIWISSQRHKRTASEWIEYLMKRFGDYRLSQFARRLNLNYMTVSAWKHSKNIFLTGAAETLLLFAYFNSELFPEK